MPKILTIVVTFNNQADIMECLESLESQTVEGQEIVVVDNASTDKTLEIVQTNWPKLKTVRNSKNLGFSRANNLALGNERAEYFAFVNADTVSDPDVLRACTSELESRPTSGACQPRIMLHDDKSKLNSRGNVANFLFFAWPDGYGEIPDPRASADRIAFASGAATVYTKACLDATGGFDEDLFMYEEDLDLGLRSFLLGFDTVYSPSSAVYHKYAYRESPQKYFFLERNRLLVLLKVYRLTTLLAVFPAFVASEIGVVLKASSEGWFPAKLRSYGSILRCLPGIVSKRKKIQESRIRSDTDLLRVLRGSIHFAGLKESHILATGNRLLDEYHRFLLTLRI